MKGFRSDVSWLLDSLSSSRSECSIKAITVAPYTNKSLKMMQAVVAVESATQEMLDMVTVMMQYGSDQLSDLEIHVKRFLHGGSVESGTIDSLDKIEAVRGDRLSPHAWHDMFHNLQKSLKELAKSSSSSQGSKKEKAVMTQPVVDLSPLQRIAKEPVPGAPPEREIPTIGMRSTSPRMRARQMKPRDAVAHVDRVVDEYVRKQDVRLPENFARVDPAGNQFYFGSKKIELVPVDKFACVKVGGGYLLFDEFCRKYCDQEQRRMQYDLARTTPRVAIERSGATSYGRPSASASPMATPRTGGTTPRVGVVVRRGNQVGLF